ncbi:hypothetical protein ACHAXS_008928 [Conticribra weissflogii]
MTLPAAAFSIPVISVAVSSTAAFQSIHVQSSHSIYAFKLSGVGGYQRSTFHPQQKNLGYSSFLTNAFAVEDGRDDVLDQLIEKFAIPLQPLDFKPLFDKGASDSDGQNNGDKSDADITSNGDYDGDNTAEIYTETSANTANSKTSTTAAPDTKISADNELGSSSKKFNSITKSLMGRDSQPAEHAASDFKGTNTPSNSLPSSGTAESKSVIGSKPATVLTSSAKKEGDAFINNSKMSTRTDGSDSSTKEDDIVVKMEEASKSESSRPPKQESDLIVKMDEEMMQSPKKTSLPPVNEGSDLVVRIDDGISAQGITAKAQPVDRGENELFAKMEDDIKLNEITSSKSAPKDSEVTSNPNTDLVAKTDGTKNLEQGKHVIANNEVGDNKSARTISAADESKSPPAQSQDTTSTTLNPSSNPFQPFNFDTYEQDDGEVENAIATSVDAPISLPIPNLGIGDIGLVGGLVLGVSFYLGLSSMLKRSDDSAQGQFDWDGGKVKENVRSNLDEDDKQTLTLDQSLEVDKVTASIKDVFVDKTTTEKSEKAGDKFVRRSTLNVEDVEQVKQLDEAKKLPFQQQGVPRKIDAELSALEDRLSSLAKDYSQYKPTASSNKPTDNSNTAMDAVVAMSMRPTTSERQIKKIEEYCEAGKVNMECSSSISSYLGSLSGQRVDQGVKVAAKSTITSYLDSLSSNNDISGQSSRYENKLSARGAAFSNYLDALSSGEVKAAPSPKAVAGYLDKMKAETSQDDESTDDLGYRIVEMEQRLSRLETSVANLPDDIASRLSDWQELQDQKIDDEMAKIMELLVDVKSNKGRDER